MKESSADSISLKHLHGDRAAGSEKYEVVIRRPFKNSVREMPSPGFGILRFVHNHTLAF
jgi:hypothetical protein